MVLDGFGRVWKGLGGVGMGGEGWGGVRVTLQPPNELVRMISVIELNISYLAPSGPPLEANVTAMKLRADVTGSTQDMCTRIGYKRKQ